MTSKTMMELSAIARHLKTSSHNLEVLPNNKYGFNGRQYYLKDWQAGSYKLYKILSTKIK
jgi:hypothetical protein